MKRWKDSVDRQLQDTIGDGDISHLPGAGKPLKLRDESLTPAEFRVAHKIMGDHEMIPDWIAAGRLLEQLEARLRQQLKHRAARYLREKEFAAAPGNAGQAKAVEKSWIEFRSGYIERVGRYNRDALLYNLKAPKGIEHKYTLDGEALIRRALQSKR